MYVDLGADGTTGEPAKLVVDPDKLAQLKQGFEDEAERIRTWIFQNGESLRNVQHAGEDECSKHMASNLSKNGQSAIDAANAYIERLKSAASKLDETARAYQAGDEDNASKFRQQEPE